MPGQGCALLAVVCRNPDVGRVKTRLIPALGEEGARALYRAFLQDLGLRFSGRGYDLLWAYTPEGGQPPATLTPGPLLSQEGPDLGHRLRHIFSFALQSGYSRVVVIKSDVPHLPASVVEEAFRALERADVVLAPSEDGGYHLVGLTEAHDIFTMVPMSTSAVFAQTVEVVTTAGLRVELLEADFDVDEPADLLRLVDRLALDPALRGSHTASVLQTWFQRSRIV